MAVAVKVPEVYAGFGANDGLLRNNEILSFDNKEILTGPNWFYTLTGNAGGTTTQTSSDGATLGRGGRYTWYCLDLLNKYHTSSPLKQFHALTFYFRDSNKPTNGAIITSMLPETFTYSIGGNYTSPISLSGGELSNTIANLLTEGSKSLAFSADTSVIWQSPKRMEIVFKIPVFDDSGTGTHRNYQEAIELFSEAILPEVGEDGLYNSIPGPNLFRVLAHRATEGSKTKAAATFSEMASRTKGQAIKHLYGRAGIWDRICVQIGGMLLLDWCVIKDLKVTFPNTKAQVLHDFRKRGTMGVFSVDDTMCLMTDNAPDPSNVSLHGGYNYKVHLQPIQAELEVTVSTVMGITRATFKDMLFQNTSRKAEGKENARYQGKTLEQPEQFMTAAPEQRSLQ